MKLRLDNTNPSKRSSLSFFIAQKKKKDFKALLASNRPQSEFHNLICTIVKKSLVVTAEMFLRNFAVKNVFL